MTPEEAEAVLKVAGWSFENEGACKFDGGYAHGRWYAVHESDKMDYRVYMVGQPNKKQALKIAWAEQFNEQLVLS